MRPLPPALRRAAPLSPAAPILAGRSTARAAPGAQGRGCSPAGPSWGRWWCSRRTTRSAPRADGPPRARLFRRGASAGACWRRTGGLFRAPPAAGEVGASGGEWRPRAELPPPFPVACAVGCERGECWCRPVGMPLNPSREQRSLLHLGCSRS